MKQSLVSNGSQQSARSARYLSSMSKSLFPDRAGPRILIADDDLGTSEMLRSTDGDAYQIVSVNDGREAFRLLRCDAEFSVAIFNMTMQHLHGLDILRYMKTEKRLMRIPVIVVSGEGGIRSVADSFAAGAIAFLAKPFTSEQLQRTLRLALSAQPPTQEVARAA